MKTTVQILKDARELLVTKGWTKGTYARGKSGRPVTTREAATCFCTLGAISTASGEAPNMDGGRAAWKAFEFLLPDGYDVADWNDEECRTAEEVLAKFDEAIAAEEAKADAPQQ